MIAQIAAIVSILGVGVVYGTDVFGALVLRPALARVDDAALTSVTGRIHRFGDRRMPIPGIVGIVGAAATTVSAALSGRPVTSALAAAALVLLIVWLVLYLRISAPINRTLTAAAEAGDVLPNVRDLQRAWDRIIIPRALLQGIALLALCVSLAS